MEPFEGKYHRETFAGLEEKHRQEIARLGGKAYENAVVEDVLMHATDDQLRSFKRVRYISEVLNVENQQMFDGEINGHRVTAEFRPPAKYTVIIGEKNGRFGAVTGPNISDGYREAC